MTNRIPRSLFTRFMGWFSQIRHPVVRDASIAIWQRFATLDLHEARKSNFDSLHDCFIRELKAGARPVGADPAILVSPCDAIVGAAGRIDGSTLIQAKGFQYSLDELLLDEGLAARHRNGCYATLRITASMYHRFHAPHDCQVNRVTYVTGDAWNVNPAAVKRVEKLFCRNERAVVETTLQEGNEAITLVPVAAILVASIRLHFIDVLLHLRYAGPNRMDCNALFRKGEEMGWFQHGSTIIVLTPPGFALSPGVRPGLRIRMGEPLLLRTQRSVPGTLRAGDEPHPVSTG